MDYARLETALLKDVTDDYYFGASCRSCLHGSRLNIGKLRAYLGDEFPVKKIRERLKCELCGKREVIVTFLGPHQRSGNLAYLFAKAPRR